MDTSRILQTFDLKRLDAIRNQIAVDRDVDVHKYLDIETWVPTNVRRAYALGLEGGPRRRVLDIGCGAGYFTYVCRMLGHHAVASDCDLRWPIYVELTKMLAVDVRKVDVQPFLDLPPIGMYDLVTSYMVTFNGHGTSHLWGHDEWKYFLNDVRSHVFPGGRFCMEMNRNLDTGTCYSEELEGLFASYGASFTGSYPHYPERGGKRLVFQW